MRIIEARFQECKGEPWSEWGELDWHSDQASLAAVILNDKLEGSWPSSPVKVTVERSDGLRSQYRRVSYP